MTGTDGRTGRRRRPLLGAVVAALVTGLLVGPPASADEPVPADPAAVAVVEPPALSGAARYDAVLRATAGRYDPADAAVSWQWRRDGQDVPGATGPAYRLVGADVGHRVGVRVTATSEGRTPAVTTLGGATVAPAEIVLRSAPTVSGTRRYGRTVSATAGRWSTTGLTVRYRWFRDASPISGATKRRHTIAPGDVGHRLRLRVTVSKRHHRTTSVTVSAGTVRHRRDAHRTMTYSVRRDGARADLATFRRQVAQTLADARGWRGAGVRFREVRSGGDVTLVLAKASRLPAYSSECSVHYSCRVGRNVVINEDRWNGATRVWRQARRSLRDYRHMVVNHEVGHALERGHLTCPGRGRAAPIMQQQSKGLHGCTANPWPRPDEL